MFNTAQYLIGSIY